MKAVLKGVLLTSVALAAASGCGAVLNRDPDSETNWFRICAADADCKGEAACLCGVCTRPCDGDGDCSGVSRGAACLPAERAPACGEGAAASLCLAECSGDGDCEAGLGCRSGLCVGEVMYLPGFGVGPPARQTWGPWVNPTGSCVPPDDGGRPGTHSPEPGDAWLPDCEGPLLREYWRVFARDMGASAYVIPRPDGAPELAEPCADPTHPLGEVVRRYPLCESATSPADAEAINAMTPEDAFAVTRFLHTRLVFRARAGSEGIQPPPLPTDIVDACEMPGEIQRVSPQICEQERARLQSGDDIGFSYTGPEAVGLAGALNELYGIDAPPQGTCELPPDSGPCEAAIPRYYHDPQTGSCEPFTYGGCEGNANNFETREACEAACDGRIEWNGCSVCTDAGCEAASCDPCPATRDATGACTTEGLRCNWGPGCGGGECGCEDDGTGSLAWLCGIRPC